MNKNNNVNWSNCYILVNDEAYRQYFDATGKAPEDIENILLGTGGVHKISNACHNAPNIRRCSNKLKGYIREIRNGFKQAHKISSALPNGSVLIYQYPSVFFGDYPELYVCLLLLRFFTFLCRKTIKVMFILHDLPSIRFKDHHLMRWERRIFPFATYVVSHNEHMTEYIIDRLSYTGKIESLDIFDYLVTNPKEHKLHLLHTPVTIAYAGNLVKPGFIYKLKEVVGNCQFHLYGKMHDDIKNILSANCEYKGCYQPESLPEVMNEDFGLIWDGDNVDRVSGLMGEYMRYNNPHKLSLYIVAHIPVIVWKRSAIASFVESNNIGIAVDSLNDIETQLRKITVDEYSRMQDSTTRLASELTAGRRIIKTISRLLDRETEEDVCRKP